MSKGFKIIALFLIFCTMLSGCAASRHLKDLVIVEGMGIDEKDNGIVITVQTLNLGINNGSQTPDGNMTVNTKKKGNSLTDSINNLSKALSKRMFFGQNKLIVIGRTVAENDISENLDYFLRSADSRADVAVCVSDTTANDIIESKENDAFVPCENILYLIENNEKSGLSTLMTTEEIINLYADKTSDIYLPVLEKEKESNVNTKGIGLFSAEKLVYVTDDEETSGFVIMMSKPKDIYVEVKDEKLGKIGVRLSKIRCKKSAASVNGTVVFSIKVNADMLIEEVENGINNSMSDEESVRIISLAEEKISQLCSKAFAACKSSNSDSLRIGEQLAKDDAAAYDIMSNDWDKYFSASKIEVGSEITLKKISDNTQVE